MTVRRNAENKFVRYCTRLQTDDLGAAIGKITHDAMLGEAAAVVIDFACRVPFDPEVLSALAHARGLRTDGFQHIEVGKCEETFNSILKMLQFSMKQRCQGTRRRTARKQASCYRARRAIRQSLGIASSTAGCGTPRYRVLPFTLSPSGVTLAPIVSKRKPPMSSRPSNARQSLFGELTLIAPNTLDRTRSRTDCSYCLSPSRNLRDHGDREP